jgi:(S)-2-hydroxy-acid oxidase
MDPITVEEIELVAKDKLPKHVYDFYASGSDSQRALVRNRDAFSRSLASTPISQCLN